MNIHDDLFRCQLSLERLDKPVVDTCGHVFSDFHIRKYFDMRSLDGINCMCPIYPHRVISINELARHTLYEYAIRKIESR